MMKNQKPSGDDDLVEVFSDVFGRLMGYATTDWINVEISTAQIKVLFVLHFSGKKTVNQLADALHIGASTASHLVEKLVKAGYAMRVDSTMDRRIVDVHVTDQGHALADRLSGVTHKEVLGQWLGQLSKADRAALGSSLRALLKIME